MVKGEFLVAQWAKDPALPLLWLKSLLWHRSIPGPETSACHPHSQKKKWVKDLNTKVRVMKVGARKW